MPPKSSLKTTDNGRGAAGAGGRRPMKTTLLSSSQSQQDQDDLVTRHLKCSEPASGSVVAAASGSVLDKISRNCSSEEKKYLAGLSILEQKVCFIAQDHLESSFDLRRSGGFIAWKNSGGGGGGGGGN